MIIKVDEKYFLEKDSYCYMVKEYNGKKNKGDKDLGVTLGYYSNLGNALNKLSELKTIDKFKDGETTIGEYIAEYHKQSKIMKAITEAI